MKRAEPMLPVRFCHHCLASYESLPPTYHGFNPLNNIPHSPPPHHAPSAHASATRRNPVQTRLIS